MTRCTACRRQVIAAYQRDGTAEAWCLRCLLDALVCADRWLRLWEQLALRRLRELAGE